MIVTMPPPFSWTLFFNQFVRHWPAFPLNQPKIRLYYRASNSIWNAIRLLGLSSDDNVLFPAYHCGLELDAILKAGVGVKFYPVNRDTKVDPELIRANINRKTKALYIIHYFGFPQEMVPIVEICRQSGLFLIEDCAQAFYSRSGDRSIGIDGDLSIFSMWKTVPIPFGGALLVNSATLPLPDGSVRPSHYETLCVMMKLLAIRFTHWRIMDCLIRKVALDSNAWLVRLLKRKPVHILEFDIERKAWEIPPISRRMLFGVDEQEIVQRRRRHFQAFLHVTHDAAHLTPLFTTLPDGVCPLFFPVLVNDSRQFSNYMESQGVNSLRVWERYHSQFPKEEFPDATFLKSHLVALPVHQHLQRSDIDLICDSLLEWGRERARHGFAD